MSVRKNLKVGQIDWSYLDSESGEEIWLAFHGYGQDAEIMHHFMKALRPNDRILSFDLPLHGNTTIYKNRPMEIGDLGELAGVALREVGASKCSLCGFSLGGKVVLKMVELTPATTDRMVLIAPDGLKINPLYRFVAKTLLGRILFSVVIWFPQPLFFMSGVLAKTGLMNGKIHQFVSDQMGTREKREKVLRTWITFKHITPSLDQVRKRIWRYKVRPTLIFGKHDRVIHPKLAKKLSGKNCSSAEVILLDTGHNLTTKTHAEILRERIQ